MIGMDVALVGLARSGFGICLLVNAEGCQMAVKIVLLKVIS